MNVIEYLYPSIENIELESVISIDINEIVPGGFSGYPSEDYKNNGFIYVLKNPLNFNYDVLTKATAVVSVNLSLASHLALICRTKTIPLITIKEEVLNRLLDNPRQIIYDSKIGLGYGSATMVGTRIDQVSTILNSTIDGSQIGFKVNCETIPDLNQVSSINHSGIGVYRIEHALLSLDIRPQVQSLIMGQSTKDVVNLLLDYMLTRLMPLTEALDGKEIVIRTIDPPKHEFFPGLLQPENNPMMGSRGIRLLVDNPDLAYFHFELINQLGYEHSSLLLPFVTSSDEFEYFKKTYSKELDTIRLGLMIETPSACLSSFPEADFFSLGTNDLTQFTYALSRDDYFYPNFSNEYFDGRLVGEPFGELGKEVIDLLSIFKDKNSGRPISLCGEHGVHPSMASISKKLELDSVSVSAGSLAVTIANFRDLHER